MSQKYRRHVDGRIRGRQQHSESKKTLPVEHTNFQGLLFSRVTFAMTYMSCFDDILPQGRRQVKTCGVDRHGERGARAYNGIWRPSDPPTPPLCKNSSDLYQFQERPLAKVGWTYMSTPCMHWRSTPLYCPCRLLPTELKLLRSTTTSRRQLKTFGSSLIVL